MPISITKAGLTAVHQLGTEPVGTLKGWLCVREGSDGAHACVTGCIGTAKAVDLASSSELQADYGDVAAVQACYRGYLASISIQNAAANLKLSEDLQGTEAPEVSIEAACVKSADWVEGMLPAGYTLQGACISLQSTIGQACSESLQNMPQEVWPKQVSNLKTLSTASLLALVEPCPLDQRC